MQSEKATKNIGENVIQKVNDFGRVHCQPAKVGLGGGGGGLFGNSFF